MSRLKRIIRALVRVFALAFLALVALIVVLYFIGSKTNRRGIYMAPSLSQEDTAGYRGPIPDMYGLPGEIHALFPVPVANAVGTNDMENAITLMRFVGDRIDYDFVRKDFLGEVGGGNLCFLPVFSQSTIGYSQTRRFVLFDVTNGAFEKHSVCQSFDEMIEGVSVLDGAKRLFISQIRDLYNDKDGRRFLRSIQFTGKTFEQIAEKQIGAMEPTHTWTVCNGTVFTVDNERLIMEALDTSLRPVEHPLARYFNAERRYFKYIREILVHPRLPFAVLFGSAREDKEYVWLIDWRDTTKIRATVIVGGPGVYVNKFQFSPDGSWLMYWDQSTPPGMTYYRSPQPSFYVMPVLSKGPSFLGPSRLLGKVLRQYAGPTIDGTAWISEPLSYVVSDSKMIYKWDFAKLGFRNEAYTEQIR